MEPKQDSPLLIEESSNSEYQDSQRTTVAQFNPKSHFMLIGKQKQKEETSCQL